MGLVGPKLCMGNPPSLLPFHTDIYSMIILTFFYNKIRIIQFNCWCSSNLYKWYILTKAWRIPWCVVRRIYGRRITTPGLQLVLRRRWDIRFPSGGPFHKLGLESLHAIIFARWICTDSTPHWLRYACYLNLVYKRRAIYLIYSLYGSYILS